MTNETLYSCQITPHRFLITGSPSLHWFLRPDLSSSSAVSPPAATLLDNHMTGHYFHSGHV